MKMLTEEEYEELLRDQRKLRALEAGGVDNWEWYEASLEDYWKEEEARDAARKT